MERIRKALDLARMERYRLLGPRDVLKPAAETPRPDEMPRPAETIRSVASFLRTEIVGLVETRRDAEVFKLIEGLPPAKTAELGEARGPTETTPAARSLDPVETVRPVEAIGPVETTDAVEICEAAETTRLVELLSTVETWRPVEARSAAPTAEPSEIAAPSAETITPSAESPRSVEPTVTVSPAPIAYSRTKTFSPSRQLLEANRILKPSGASPAVAAFRMLRTQVLQRMKEHQWRSLAVLSPGSEDGKTTTAINLAVTLANDHQHTVLLVEFDLKRPRIANMLGISPEMGADDLLRGAAGLEDCLYHPEGFDRLVVLPARAAMEHSSEVLPAPGAARSSCNCAPDIRTDCWCSTCRRCWAPMTRWPFCRWWNVRWSSWRRDRRAATIW